MTRKPNLQKTKSSPDEDKSNLPTFMDHVYELRRRLFWVIMSVFVASAIAYPYLEYILHALTAPLNGQELYYLTPVGGFSFSIKICLYAGIIATVPILIYHLYKYFEPLMNHEFRRSSFSYLSFSTILAALGVSFAYFLALPSALRFLTGIDLDNVEAMLTVDSYLSFVVTYLIGSALLFQIPLLLSVINKVTPLKPRKLFSFQRYVIVGAFVLAAIISPTPDAMNQTLFAAPIILMYEFGVLIIWLQNKKSSNKGLSLAATD